MLEALRHKLLGKLVYTKESVDKLLEQFEKAEDAAQARQKAINDHNASSAAHENIRQAIAAETKSRKEAIAAEAQARQEAIQAAVDEHDADIRAHPDLRDELAKSYALLNGFRARIDYLTQFIEAALGSTETVFPLVTEDGAYLVTEAGDYLIA